MKKAFALLLAVLSGGYVFGLGWIPDPLPILDEGLALLIFVQSTAALGVDVRQWVPFLRSKNSLQEDKKNTKSGNTRVVDV